MIIEFGSLMVGDVLRLRAEPHRRFFVTDIEIPLGYFSVCEIGTVFAYEIDPSMLIYFGDVSHFIG